MPLETWTMVPRPKTAAVSFQKMIAKSIAKAMEGGAILADFNTPVLDTSSADRIRISASSKLNPDLYVIYTLNLGGPEVVELRSNVKNRPLAFRKMSATGWWLRDALATAKMIDLFFREEAGGLGLLS